ncbi:MAG: hypothetical protein WDO24_14930 [Pseudomonadota bacterium]
MRPRPGAISVSGPTQLAGAITSGGTVTFTGAVTLTAAGSIDTTVGAPAGNAIHFAASVMGAGQTLSL